MSKRAKYVGPFEEVYVCWPPGETAVSAMQVWTVKQGDLLSDDAPAKLRDELLQGDDWAEADSKEGDK